MSITSYKTGTVSPSSLLVGNAAFNPPTTVDYLVVAGGGSGGADRGGGGGAGGFRTATSFSVSSGTSHTART